MYLINKLFSDETIRTVWSKEDEKYYISVVDIVKVLTDSKNPRHYWNVLKGRLKEEGNESVTNCDQLKLKAAGGKVAKNTRDDIEQLLGETIVTKENKLKYQYADEKKIIDNNNRLRLVQATGTEAIEMGIRDAMEFGPFLIVDGVKQKLGLYAGGFQRTSRTVIAQREDGIMLFVVTDNYGRFYQGPNMNELADKLLLYGVVNAANLDGGGSSQLVVNGKLYNHPVSIYHEPVNGGNGRSVVNGWGLVVGSSKNK